MFRVRNFAVFAFGVLVAFAFGVLAQSGGYPTNIRARTVNAGQSTPLTGLGDIAGRRLWVQGSAGGAAETIYTGTTAEGYTGAGSNEFYLGSSTADPVNFYYNNTKAFAIVNGTTLQGPGAVDMTPAVTSSRLTSQTFSGCSASSGASNMFLRKMGNFVDVYFELTCTANAASAPTPAVGVIPSGYRPTTGTIFGLPMTAIGTSAASNASFGTVAITTAGTLTFALQDGATWDAAGSKGFWFVATYPTDY